MFSAPVRVGEFPCYVTAEYYHSRYKTSATANFTDERHGGTQPGEESTGALTITPCKRIYAPNKKERAKYFYIFDGHFLIKDANYHLDRTLGHTVPSSEESNQRKDFSGSFHIEAWLFDEE